jgi:hypothetical protein
MSLVPLATDANLQLTQVAAADARVYDFQPPWKIMAVSIQNLSNTDAVVIDNTGRQFTVSAGNIRTVNLPADWIAVRSIAVGTGIIVITLYATEQSPTNTGGTVNATILNSVLTAVIQGTVTAIISGTVNTNITNAILQTAITGTVQTNITNSTLATTISGNVNTIIQNALLSMQDVVVENNTTALAGVLANTVQALNMTQGVTYSQTINKAIEGFAVVLNNPEGFFDCWYNAGGLDVYLIRQYPFYWASNNTWQPIEKQLEAAIPSGSAIRLRFQQGINTVSGLLKY